jgi:hypothetical protein
VIQIQYNYNYIGKKTLDAEGTGSLEHASKPESRTN